MRERYEIPTAPGKMPLAWYPATGSVKWVKASGLESDSGLSLPIPGQDFDPDSAPNLFTLFSTFFFNLALAAEKDRA